MSRGQLEVGAGLGLAIVSEHTAAMGGSATVANRPTGGAQFAINLPTGAQERGRNRD